MTDRQAKRIAEKVLTSMHPLKSIRKTPNGWRVDFFGTVTFELMAAFADAFETKKIDVGTDDYLCATCSSPWPVLWIGGRR